MRAAETASDPQSRAASPSVARALARWVTAAFDSAATSRSTALAKPGFFAGGAGRTVTVAGVGRDPTAPAVFGSVGSVVRRAAAWARC